MAVPALEGASSMALVNNCNKTGQESLNDELLLSLTAEDGAEAAQLLLELASLKSLKTTTKKSDKTENAAKLNKLFERLQQLLAEKELKALGFDLPVRTQQTGSGSSSSEEQDANKAAKLEKKRLAVALQQQIWDKGHKNASTFRRLEQVCMRIQFTMIFRFSNDFKGEIIAEKGKSL